MNRSLSTWRRILRDLRVLLSITSFWIDRQKDLEQKDTRAMKRESRENLRRNARFLPLVVRISRMGNSAGTAIGFTTCDRFLDFFNRCSGFASQAWVFRNGRLCQD